MARITRKQQKIFAESATNNGVFGSLQENNPTYSNDPDTIQGRPAYAQGWNGATYSSELLPPLEEFQALQYLFSRQIAYLLQDGVAEWNTATPYYKGSIVKTISGTNIKLFRSLANNNTGNQTTDTSKWALIYDSQNPYANSNFDNITDFSKNISNWSTNTTNCITEIPQDINLELSSGTLTLKSGSKAYMPNGSGVFDVVTNSRDLTCTQTTDGEFFVCETYNGNGITTRLISACTSGAGATAVSGFAYDTTTNKINNYSEGGVAGGQYTFPIAIVTVSGGAISSIDKVFNGFGYIGSSVFALPGVKGLIPNGRNEDGTLKNTTSVLSSVSIYTPSPIANNYRYSLAFRGAVLIFYNNLVYNEEENKNYAGGTYSSWLDAGYLYFSDNKISELKVKPAFHAVDYYDFKQADDNNVKLTGNQSYSGIKTATTVNGIQTSVSGSNNIIQNNTAVSILDSSRQSASVNGYTVYDKDSRVAGMFGTSFNTDGSVQSFMRAVSWNSTTQSPQAAHITVKVSHDGNITTSAPTPDATDNSTKIATTSMLQSWANINNANCLSTWSKGEKGYFKFKNGLIVQWGTISSGTVNAFNSVTLPIPFSSATSYSVTATGKSTRPNYSDYNTVINSSNKTATSFQVSWDDNDSGAHWLAIGY